jgi:hypothetical protein
MDMEGPSVVPDKWMDFIKAPLNPCSIETIPEPVALADGSQVWPLMMACYELDEDETGQKQQRRGQLNLHMVNVPDMSSEKPAFPLSFGEPQVVLRPKQKDRPNSPDDSTGILDGHWTPMPARGGVRERNWAFATAHSSGEIRIQALHVPTTTLDDESEVDHRQSTPLYQIKHAGKSSGPQLTASESVPLCLSLNWDANDGESQHTRIASSYSNGSVAINDVVYKNGTASLIESDSWQAHSMFKSPAEVWSVCFASQCFDAKAIISCGDEGTCKVWDIRATSRPAQTLKHFDAGITCVSPHPRQEHMLAVGSYDETMCLYDTRYFRPLFQTKKLGGGIWRIQWHPINNRRLLAAVMHGGARVINVKGFESYQRSSVWYVYAAELALHMLTFDPCPSASYILLLLLSPSATADDEFLPITPYLSFGGGSPPELSPSSSSLSTASNMHCKVTKEFREHGSMCYGTDWLVMRHPEHRQSYFEAVASCSFYDRAAYLWDSVY